MQWVRGASIRRENVIASNNAYDERYLKYFTGVKLEEEMRTFGHAHPFVSGTPAPHFSILAPAYKSLRHVKHVPVPSSSSSMLIDYGHDHPVGSSVEWRSQLGQPHIHNKNPNFLPLILLKISNIPLSSFFTGRDFSRHVIDIVSTSPLTSDWNTQTLKNAYPKRYTPLSLVSHTLLLLLPYQVQNIYASTLFPHCFIVTCASRFRYSCLGNPFLDLNSQ